MAVVRAPRGPGTGSQWSKHTSTRMPSVSEIFRPPDGGGMRQLWPFDAGGASPSPPPTIDFAALWSDAGALASGALQLATGAASSTFATATTVVARAQAELAEQTPQAAMTLAAALGLAVTLCCASACMCLCRGCADGEPPYARLKERSRRERDSRSKGDSARGRLAASRLARWSRSPGSASARSPMRSRHGAPGCAFNRPSDTPAPGDYENVFQHSLEKRSQFTFNVPYREGRGNFGTFEMREAGGIRDETGEPGAYADYALSLASRSGCSVNSQVREGRIAFGSNTARDKGSSVDEGGSGLPPGKYSYKHLYETGQIGAKMAMNSSFKSVLPLGAHVRYSDTPGAGSYYPERYGSSYERVTYSKLGSSSFAGDSPQRHLPADARPGVSPGPESYEQGQFSITTELRTKHNPRLPGFASSSRRSDPTTWC